MTDNNQQNLDSAGDSPSKPGTFKKGFDSRRWLQGRPKVPKNIKELADHLLWDVASEEIENPVTHEKIDRLRALLRSMTTSKQSADKQEFLNRLLGKVPQNVDVTSGGEKLTQIGLNTVDYRSDITKTEE